MEGPNRSGFSASRLDSPTSTSAPSTNARYLAFSQAGGQLPFSTQIKRWEPGDQRRHVRRVAPQ